MDHCFRIRGTVHAVHVHLVKHIVLFQSRHHAYSRQIIKTEYRIKVCPLRDGFLHTGHGDLCLSFTLNGFYHFDALLTRHHVQKALYPVSAGLSHLMGHDNNTGRLMLLQEILSHSGSRSVII